MTILEALESTIGDKSEVNIRDVIDASELRGSELDRSTLGALWAAQEAYRERYGFQLVRKGDRLIKLGAIDQVKDGVKKLGQAVRKSRRGLHVIESADPSHLDEVSNRRRSRVLGLPPVMLAHELEAKRQELARLEAMAAAEARERAKRRNDRPRVAPPVSADDTAEVEVQAEAETRAAG